MEGFERLTELIGQTRRDLLPSMVGVSEQDDLRLILVVILQVLERRGELTVKQVASHVGRSESRTSRLVDQLVQRDLVDRTEDLDDRRRKRVRLTSGGVAYLKRLDATRAQAQAELWRHLEPEERHAMLHNWELFAKAARRLRDARHED